MPERIVVALGGNAILKPKQQGTIEQQLANVDETCRHIASMVQAGHEVVVTHGNGPQVGNILIQNEEASTTVPPMPLDVCGAQSQGQIGYMIQRSLDNRLRQLCLDREVVTLITQVVVDEEDPAFSIPTKPIGPHFTKARAQRLIAERGYQMRETTNGWRRVVPSPKPIAIREIETILSLVQRGVIVISSGGGGIPVVRRPSGELIGVEAVIDKDRAGERLAHDLEASVFLILTDVDQVAINFRKPTQRFLDRLTVAEAQGYLQEHQFPPGSMGPKVQAAVAFAKLGGRAIITSLELASKALEGRAGTVIVEK